MVDGTRRAFVADLSPPELKATAMGAYHSAIGIAALPGGLVAGALWQNLSPSATFLFGAVMSVVGIVLVAPVKIPGRRE